MLWVLLNIWGYFSSCLAYIPFNDRVKNETVHPLLALQTERWIHCLKVRELENKYCFVTCPGGSLSQYITIPKNI